MSRYFSFTGLAMRQEYWAVVFITFAVTFFGTIILEGLMFTGTTGIYIGVIGLIALVIAALWLQFATAARRCRDAGISPWWVLLFLIPYVNFVATIVYGCLQSKPAEVEYV